MTDWVAQDDWSQVKVGDQVRVERDGTVIIGKVDDCYGYGSALGAGVYKAFIWPEHLTELAEVAQEDWQLSVPAKPAVELPTEPGSVITWSRDGLLRLAYLEGSGLWDIDGTNYSERDLLGEIKDSVFIPMEPVAETAKKVIEFIESDLSCDSYDTARKEFGVSDD